MSMRSVLVGTYTTGTRSQGIYRVRVDAETGRLSDKELLIKTRDASYLLPVPGGLYWVDEALGESMGQVCCRMEGKIHAVPSGGVNPCHLAMSGDGKWLAAANYTDGTVSVFRVTEDGPVPAGRFPGRHGSVNPARQEGPHAHFVCFAGERLYASDLGADEIRVLHLRDGVWTEEENPGLTLDGGDGPRHFLISGDTWYIITELSNRLYRIRPEERTFLSLIGPGETGTAAALRSDRENLYCTQRGEDLLIVARDTGSGLEMTGRFPVEGRTPRDCLPLGKTVLCACQDSGEIVSMLRDGNTWKTVDRMEMPGAVGLAEEADAL